VHNKRKSGLNVNVLAIRYCIDMRRQFSCDSKQEKKKKKKKKSMNSSMIKLK
jgi:hypothetical protein